jgi:hypothetical protein
VNERPDELRADGASTDDRRRRLLGIKLRALVADHVGREVDAEAQGFPSGAALTVDDVAWVLVDGPAPRSLGPALAWAIRHAATALHLVAEHDTGLLARRAQRLRFPVTVWYPQDRTLLPVVPEPLAPSVGATAEHLAFAPTIEAAGATVNVEHGVVVGEVRGLEVCRVVDTPTVGHFAELGDFDAPSGGDAGDGVLLEVGVGPNDREAFRMLHGDIPTVEALTVVVDSVLAARRAETVQHPLNRLGQERYLRWQLEQDPSLVDMATVTPSEPPQPRPNLKEAIPCVARGIDGAGQEWTLVCSVGVDVDLVGFVADVQSTSAARVAVVLRERDAISLTRELLALLATAVDVRVV